MSLLVITATRGSSLHLEATVRSVAALGDSARHVLVCPEALGKTLAKAYPHTQVVHESGGGLYAAINDARSSAKEDFVTYINDDDLLDAAGLVAARRCLASDESLAFVYGRVAMIDAQGKELGELPIARRAEDLLALIAGGIMPLAQPGTLCRRSGLDKLGWFDSTFRLAGDLDLFVRALTAGLTFAYVDQRVALFRIHAGQLSKAADEAREEHARAISGLELSPSLCEAALRRFRWDNRWVYLQRMLRHGPKRMSTLYKHG